MYYISNLDIINVPLKEDTETKGSNPEKKAASFWTFSKREGGVQHESKSFGVVLFGPPFGHYRGRGEGVEPIPKVLG